MGQVIITLNIYNYLPCAATLHAFHHLILFTDEEWAEIIKKLAQDYWAVGEGKGL